MNVVIYARFSCHSQTEQSIEGQLKVCYEYAKNNNYIVVGEYIDRAQSARTDHRPEFQRMINDSDKHTFEGVLVYQLDRFARNRFDSAINKAKLKKNGVRVLSAKENITDDASGILVEGVLESMAEYYSAELSQKILRGMKINAEKCLSNGSQVGLGYKVGPDRKYYVDEEEAKIVREIFERYTQGENKTRIIEDLNKRQIKTALGKSFCVNSLSKILSNKRYIGYYIYKGTETPGGMPRIISDDVFEKAQQLLEQKKRNKKHSNPCDDYILAGKLICGNCNEELVAYTGTGKMGKLYRYYRCKNKIKKKCSGKSIEKNLIEDLVIDECLKYLTPKVIDLVCEKILKEHNKTSENLTIKTLKNSLKAINVAIENLWKVLELGQLSSFTTERINQKEEEKKKIEIQLAIEQNKIFKLDENNIKAYFSYLNSIGKENLAKRKALISIFINKIVIYEDHVIIIYNAINGLKSLTVPLNRVISDLEEQKNGLVSPHLNSGPPEENWSNTVFFPGGMAIGVSLNNKTRSLPKK